MSGTDKDAPARLTADGHRRWWESPPPAWYINHVWTAPQRQSARIACREAVKEHRGGHEPETEPTVAQHRHCATWLWN